MNNKRLGTAFEREFCELLAKKGYWVHFITPDNRGAQPFDIVAAKNGEALAMDCKTCVSSTFNINRLEDNQIMAFERWIKCGNADPYIAVKHKNNVYLIRYSYLKERRSVNIERESNIFANL